MCRDTILEVGWLSLYLAVCILQSVVLVDATVSRCVNHNCVATTANRYCEIVVNSRGLQGTCITSSDITLHHDTDCQHISPPPGKTCVCSFQPCVDDVITDYNHKQSSAHLICHGHTCLNQDVCLLSADTTYSPRCGLKGRHTLCPVGSNINPITVCYCDSQTCIDNFSVGGTTHVTDAHVKCGDQSCHVHNGEMCILENTGQVYNYNHGSGYSTVSQTCSTSQTRLCLAIPELSHSCGCVNQVCVDRYAPHILQTSTIIPPGTHTVHATTHAVHATTHAVHPTTHAVHATGGAIHAAHGHIRCGDRSCSLNHNEMCILENTGNTYNYNHGVGFSTVRQTCSTSQINLCSSTPGLSQSCGCITPDCVSIYASHVATTESTTIPTIESSTTPTTESTTIVTSTTESLNTSVQQTKGVTETMESTIKAQIVTDVTLQDTTTGVEQTTHAICQDKPGVDCQLLNTTNICANPFSHVYCAAFCGHCSIRIIDTGLG